MEVAKAEEALRVEREEEVTAEGMAEEERVGEVTEVLVREVGVKAEEVMVEEERVEERGRRWRQRGRCLGR